MKKGSRQCGRCGEHTHEDEGMVVYVVDRDDCDPEKQKEALSSGENLEKYKKDLVFCSDCNDNEYYN